MLLNITPTDRIRIIVPNQIQKDEKIKDSSSIIWKFVTVD